MRSVRRRRRPARSVPASPITHLAGADAFGAPPARLARPSLHRQATAAGRARELAGAASTLATASCRTCRSPSNRAASAAISCRTSERAVERIESGELDDDEPPARIHGDLWNGNLLWDAARRHPDRPGGPRRSPRDRSGDARAVRLSVLRRDRRRLRRGAWDRSKPLPWFWRERIPLHQLHPLAVHAASYGPSYGRALHDAALATLALRALNPAGVQAHLLGFLRLTWIFPVADN